MLSAIRNRIRITPSTVIATLALIFAMSTGAYAAGKYLITKTSQIKPSVLAQLKGKAGAAGATGAAGSAGPAGPQGPAGPAGSGSPGAKGEAGPEGKQGIQGEKGEKGEKGAKGLAGVCSAAEACVLPSGVTETGTWGATGPADGNPTLRGAIVAPISFTIPLAKAPKVNIIESGNGKGGGTCPTGSSVAKPEAEPGNLCIFMSTVSTGTEGVEKLSFISPDGEEFEKASTTGTVVLLIPPEEGTPEHAIGAWAVTAE